MGSFGQNAFPSFNVMADGSESQSRTISKMTKNSIFSTNFSVREGGHSRGEKSQEMRQEQNNKIKDSKNSRLF